jgi:hypothetical protein
MVSSLYLSLSLFVLLTYRCDFFIIDGVLGGYGKLTPVDVLGSNAFLDKLQSRFPEFKLDNVADCGAGIGRVTKFLLLPRSAHVDLIEQSPRLLASAPEYIGIPESERHKVGLVEKGLQVSYFNFTIKPLFLLISMIIVHNRISYLKQIHMI